MKQEENNHLLALVAFLILGVDPALQVLEHHVADADIDAAFKVFVQ